MFVEKRVAMDCGHELNSPSSDWYYSPVLHLYFYDIRRPIATYPHLPWPAIWA